MESNLKKILRALSLELRHILEGYYDDHGKWHPGDLERRLNEMGIWRDRPAKPIGELPHLTAEDKTARKIINAYITFREEAGVSRHDAVAEFVRESAYTWANRLFILRCMETRGIIDEVILQKYTYGGRSLVHNRFARKNPVACSGEDDGLFAVLFEEYAHRVKELPSLFDPKSPAVALRPSIAALKKCIALLSGGEAIRGQEPATDAIFESPDALGWAYQYWNMEEKDRIFEMVRTKKGAKIEGADIIPVTQLYTEPYMVKFLVQNSLGAIWMGMYPESKLCEKWEYYVKDADRVPVEKKPVSEITFLDPACGSGHFHLEAFDLFYVMYEEEGVLKSPEEICASILNNNLFGIDIDGRAVQIAAAALWMKEREKAQDLDASDVIGLQDHLVATNIRLPKGKDHLEIFLKKNPEDEPLRPALETVLQGLENVHELGSLVQIEEPVERKLRSLKETSDMDKGKPVQRQFPSLEMAKPKQRELPIGVESYAVWKQRTLERIKEHFEAEAQTADTFQAFFNREAITGLTLFHLLSRRYDVVAANPPYMGSKNMGPMLKKYVEIHYTAGKRDLYAAFILRCKELAQVGGRVAMVTQQSWMFLRSFAELRAVDEDKLEKLKAGAFRGLLRDTTIETLAHLGPGAFGEISGEVVNIVLFILTNMEPSPEHRITAFRLIGQKNPEEKDKLLKHSIKTSSTPLVFGSQQCSLLSLVESPLVYWLSYKLISIAEKYGKHTSEEKTVVSQGLTTGNTPRFVRLFWECPESKNSRWYWYTSGGGFRRWAGNEWLNVDWESGGIRLRSYVFEHYPPEKFTLLIKQPNTFGQDAIYYGAVARGSIGARLCSKAIFGDSAPGVIHTTLNRYVLAGLLNTRLSSFLVRANSASVLSIRDPYIIRLPFHNNPLDDSEILTIEKLAKFAEILKDKIVATFLDERKHVINLKPINSIHLVLKNTQDFFNSCICILSQTEGLIDTNIFKYYNLDKDSIALILQETGTPFSWFPLIQNYDSFPALPADLPELPYEVIDSLKDHERCVLSTQELATIKHRLRALYESGPGSKEGFEETDEISEGDQDEEEVIAGAHIPIPPETFLEELSQKLEIHPISVYWLLKEGIEKEGWRCIPEEQRITFDRFTVMILRLLGHRWPKQIEAGEPVPPWADEDGIIPITEGCGEKTLFELIRKRIADEFPGGNVASIEREFEEIAVMSLEKWLSGPFFKRHISQFKKRPIAWQIESGDGRLAIGNRRKSKGVRTAGIQSKGPAFSCLLYYHKLGPTTLLDIRRLYVDKLRGRYETELRTLEGILELTAEQPTRKVCLEGWIDELKSLDQKLDEVARSGFCPENLRATLRQYAINDAMLSLVACWLRKLSQTIHDGILVSWQESARATDLHNDFPQWIFSAIAYLDHHCAAVCPKIPSEKEFKTDPTSADLAPIISAHAKNMVKDALSRACDAWWKQFDEAVLLPIKKQMNEEKERLKLLLEGSNKSIDGKRSTNLQNNTINNTKDEILRRSTPQNDNRCHSERSEESDLMPGKLNEIQKMKAVSQSLTLFPNDMEGLQCHVEFVSASNLKEEIKQLKKDIEQKISKAQTIRNLIESWECPEAETWKDWLSTQPLFDKFASLDGKRPPPKTIQEFIEQESAYYPDINDGVRVNIAPLQKAGLLASEVLPSKDLDKAIADRAEWRTDERRWCREGKLPMPGWWKKEDAVK